MNLRKIESKDIDELSRYLNKVQPQHSSYAISNIFLWNGCIYDVYIAWWQEIPIILEVNRSDFKKRVLFPYTDTKDISCSDAMWILNQTKADSFYYVPEEYIKEKHNELEKYFEIKEQSEFNDYLYFSKDLAELVGAKYSAKRNLIKQFERNYVDLVSIKSFSKDSLLEIINLWNKTQPQIDNSSAIDFLECEKQAIKNIERYYDYIDLFGVCVYINGELKGFAVGSHLNHNTCVLNFEKADKNIKGLYQFVDKKFAEIACQSYLFINKESDLGKEGLKKAKLSYYPFKIIRSYSLTVKR